jgi:hypothetical protein
MLHRLRAALSVLDGQKTKGPAAKSPKKPAPVKRKVSAASRKRMADGAKARWAKLRAERAKAGE